MLLITVLFQQKDADWKRHIGEVREDSQLETSIVFRDAFLSEYVTIYVTVCREMLTREGLPASVSRVFLWVSLSRHS